MLMPRDPIEDTPETVELLRKAHGGENAVLDELFSRHRERLRRMIELRMAQALRGRVDASDVIQDAFLEASQRLGDFLEKRPMPFFLWLRFLTRQKLFALHRHHVGTKARDPRREIPFDRGAYPEATSEALAAKLLGHLGTPSRELEAAETRLRLQDALNTLDPQEREILALRHFEQLSNAEAARELEITEAAASKRYMRALVRLRGILTTMNVSLTTLRPRHR